MTEHETELVPTLMADDQLNPDTVARVIAIVSEQFERESVALDETLLSLGSDSLDLVELSMGLEFEFLSDIDIPDGRITHATNVRDLAILITGLLGQPYTVHVGAVTADVVKDKDQRIADLSKALEMMLEVTDELKITDNAFAYGRLVLANDQRIGRI